MLELVYLSFFDYLALHQLREERVSARDRSYCTADEAAALLRAKQQKRRRRSMKRREAERRL